MITLLFTSCAIASEDTEKGFQVDPNIIYQDIHNKNVTLVKIYNFDNIAIDINKCNEDTIVLYKKESNGSQNYYEEVHKLHNEQLIKSQTKEIDSSMYTDMRLKIEKRLIDLSKKIKSSTQVTLSEKEINKNIKIEHIVFYYDHHGHTILRILCGKEEEIVTMPYGIAENIFYNYYSDKVIITAIVTYTGASSFSQNIILYQLNL